MLPKLLSSRLIFNSYARAFGTMTTTSQPMSKAEYQPRYVDIGINLTDPIFRGKYRGKKCHDDDLSAVINRASQVGCSKLIVTGSDIKSSREALSLAKEHRGSVFTTAGIHPCSSAIFGSRAPSRDTDHSIPCDADPSAPSPENEEADLKKSGGIIADLTKLLTETRASGQSDLVAMGEFGLDYDRLHYCSKTLQLHSFKAQLKVAASLDPQLPLFLHSRAAHSDFVRLLKDAFGDKLGNLIRGGVVHSFTGTIEEMQELTGLGLYIGVNGCSFKTVENCEVVKQIPLDRIMLETDGPWCEVRPSHEGWKYLLAAEPNTKESAEPEATPENEKATKPQPQKQKQKQKGQKKEPEVTSRFKMVKKEKWEEGAMVKGRNEPCTIERIATIVAGIKGMTDKEVCEAAWENTVRVFELENITA